MPPPPVPPPPPKRTTSSTATTAAITMASTIQAPSPNGSRPPRSCTRICTPSSDPATGMGVSAAATAQGCEQDQNDGGHGEDPVREDHGQREGALGAGSSDRRVAP